MESNQKITGTYEFSNGWGASVVGNRFTYSGSNGLFELAVLKNGEIHYDNKIAQGDVLGHLSKEEVKELLEEIKSL